MDGLTPAECIEAFPQLKTVFRWDAKCLGVFLSRGLLKGTYNLTKNISYIQVESLQELVNYRNSMLEKNKVKL